MDKQPYFRQTGKLHTKDSCIEWFEHHETLGTPVAILRSGGFYSVWLVGDEHYGEKKKNQSHVNEEVIPSDAILLKEANDFSLLAGVNLERQH